MTDEKHTAKARALNLPISTKHCIELGRELRYRSVAAAKVYLENVISLKQPVPFKRFTRDMGHKRGPLSSGRYPIKAAKEFLSLVKLVESNALHNGLNSSSLKITQVISNRASVPMSGGRQRSGAKRTHLLISVEEGIKKSKSKKENSKKEELKKENKTVDSKTESKTADSKVDQTSSVTEDKIADTIDEAKVESVEEAVEKVRPKSHIAEDKVDAIAETLSNGSNVEAPGVEAKVEEAVVEVKTKAPVVNVPIKEFTSEELLKQAQAKAAELNKKEDNSKEVKDAEKYLSNYKSKVH